MIYNFYKFKLTYNEITYANEQNLLFSKHSLDRSKGLTLYNDLKNNFNFISNPMSSEHNIMFCSLKYYNSSIKNILEIGTYDGINAFLLSEIFPNSLIDTYDLPDNSIEFSSIYNRSDISYLEKFIIDRNKILFKKKNIVFNQSNSMNLTFVNNKKYDLIWIDGAHSYPVIPIDIMNSLRLINKNGIILCDDIILKSNNYNQYSSKASIETLSILKKAGIIDYTLFYKRLSVDHNSIPNNRKFVAYITKI